MSKTALAALWEQIERSYGREAKDFLKGFYDERSREYQQERRDKEKREREERLSQPAPLTFPEHMEEERRKLREMYPAEDVDALEDDPFHDSIASGDDANTFDIMINQDSY